MTPTVPSSRRIGLVLGAGGAVGCAYHAGVIFSLEHHLGWDARDATSIVGTSAGSLVGALLRCGVGPADLIALSRGKDMEQFSADTFSRLAVSAGRPGPGVLDLVRGVRIPSVPGVLRSMRRRSLRPALLSMARRGRDDLSESITELDAVLGERWPSKDFRVCTVNDRTGERVVLDSSSDVPLSTAVAASSAVPGVFAPQTVNGRTLVDGGVHSATNVDVLDTETLDEVWVIAPMAGQVFHHLSTRHIQRYIAGQLRRELVGLPPDMPVRLFAPGPESAAAIGFDLMAPERADRTLLAGFLETGDQLARAGTSAHGAA